MRNKNRLRGKLHKGKRQKQFLTGTLCLVLAAALAYGLLDSGESLAAGGSISYVGTDYNKGLWASYYDESVRITSFTDFSIKQSLDVSDISFVKDGQQTESVEITGDTEAENTEEHRAFTAKLPIVDNTGLSLSLNNLSPVMDYKEEDWELHVAGNDDEIDYVRLNPRSSKTYYLKAANADSVSGFASFLQDVQGKYTELSPDYLQSDTMLMTREEQAGYAYKTAVEQVLSEYGATLYEEGDPINVEGLARVDLLTVTLADFYFYTENISSKWEYDIALFQTYSYELDCAGKELEAPEPELESGAALSAEGTQAVSPDDALIGLNPPDEEDTQAYEGGTLQYLLSGEELSGEALLDGGAGWQDWKEGNEIPLDGAAYLYTRVIPGEWQGTDKVYLESPPEEYKISYIDGQPAEVAAEIRAGAVLEGDSGYPGDTITLSADGGSPKILYRTDGRAFAFRKVSHADRIRMGLDNNQPESGVTFQNGADGNLYVRVNNLWYNA